MMAVIIIYLSLFYDMAPAAQAHDRDFTFARYNHLIS